jgi:hypothetical protein
VFAVQKETGPLFGRKLAVRDKDGDPRRRKVVVVARDRSLTAPVGGTDGDPTTGGATLELVNSTTGETGSMALPAANWEARGEPAGSDGYRYRDTAQADGPCRKVDVLAGKRLKALCRGAGIPFSLDEPGGQGSIGVRLTMGTDGLPLCMLFGGTVRRDTPAIGEATGSFQSKNAPLPASCRELGSPNGAFVDTVTGVLD